MLLSDIEFIPERCILVDVLVVLGSISDKDYAIKLLETLKNLGVEAEVEVASAHRSPERVKAIVKEAEDKGVKVFIAVAGLSAILPSLIAAYTLKPVIGLPVNRALEGLDSLLSMVQTPPGIPVACVGIDNAVNAAVLAAEVVALSKPSVNKKLEKYRATLEHKVEESAKKLKELL